MSAVLKWFITSFGVCVESKTLQNHPIHLKANAKATPTATTYPAYHRQSSQSPVRTSSRFSKYQIRPAFSTKNAATADQATPGSPHQWINQKPRITFTASSSNPTSKIARGRPLAPGGVEFPASGTWPKADGRLELEQAMMKQVVVWLAALLALAGAHAGIAADMNKVLRVGFPVDVTGFDPQALNDLYSNYVNRVIFEPLLGYDYLARPYKLVPNTAEALPEVSDGGKKFVIKIRKGIYFTPDPVFQGRKRELTAADDAVLAEYRLLADLREVPDR